MHTRLPGIPGIFGFAENTASKGLGPITESHVSPKRTDVHSITCTSDHSFDYAHSQRIHCPGGHQVQLSTGLDSYDAMSSATSRPRNTVPLSENLHRRPESREHTPQSRRNLSSGFTPKPLAHSRAAVEFLVQQPPFSIDTAPQARMSTYTHVAPCNHLLRLPP